MIRVLVVDDDGDMRCLAKQALEAGGFTVDVAENGDTAVAMVRGAEYAAVLMDLQMPAMDGFAVAVGIRALERELQRSPVPILPFSSDPAAENREQRVAVGMTGYVPKPVQYEELLRIVKLTLSCELFPSGAGRTSIPEHS